VCDKMNENCSTCYLDCGSCGFKQCAGHPECTSHGVCDAGVCSCDIGYFGHDCSFNETAELAVEVNRTYPALGLILADDTKHAEYGNISFVIKFTSISEVALNGDIVQNYDFWGENFTASTLLTETATTYEYIVTLPNNASVAIFISWFGSSQVITFANQTLKMNKNDLKYSMKISDWNFADISNRLLVKMQTTLESTVISSSCMQVSSSVDASDNLRWLKLTLNGVILYGMYLPYALIDSGVQTVMYDYDYVSRQVDITLPHFWSTAEFDPNFQVLTDSSGKGMCNSQYKTPEDEITIPNEVIAALVMGSLLTMSIGLAFVVKRKCSKKNAKARLPGALSPAWVKKKKN